MKNIETIRCPSCGSSDIENINSSIGKCAHCGSTMLLPKQNEEIVALLNNAYLYRANFNYDLAIKSYQFVLEKDSSELSAYEGILLSEYGIEYVKDNYTGKLIPTCHRAHFTSIYDNEYYKTLISLATDEQKEIIEQKAKEIDKLQKAIERQLKNEQEYDIFISYKATDANGDKTEDSVVAREIYDELTSKNYKVFFAEKSLEDRLGNEYEPIIFKALHTSKLFILVGTSKENVESNWVRNEWSRFIDRIRNEDSITKNSFIPVFKDMNPYDMPKVNNVFVQGVDAGKLGYITTLTDGVTKLLKPEKEQKVLDAFADLDNFLAFTKLQKQKHKELKNKNWKDFVHSKGVAKWLYYMLLSMPVLIGGIYVTLCLTTESYFKVGKTFIDFHIAFVLLILMSVLVLCVHAKKFRVNKIVNVIVPFGSLIVGFAMYLLMFFTYPITITGLSAQKLGSATSNMAEGYIYSTINETIANEKVTFAQVDYLCLNKKYENRIKIRDGKKVFFLPEKVDGYLLKNFYAEIPQDVQVLVIPKWAEILDAVHQFRIMIDLQICKNIEAVYCYNIDAVYFEFSGGAANYRYDEGLPFKIYYEKETYSNYPSHFVLSNLGYYS